MRYTDDLELERVKLEFDRYKFEATAKAAAWEEKELSLCNEIKFLIGKLLKAKSKLGTDGELLETIRK